MCSPPSLSGAALAHLVVVAAEGSTYPDDERQGDHSREDVGEHDREQHIAVARAARESISPQRRLENSVHPWSAFVVLPLFALANGALINMIMASRIVYGMSRERILPAGLGRVHAGRRTPWVAILGTTAVTMVLIAGQVTFGFLESWSRTMLAIAAAIGIEMRVSPDGELLYVVESRAMPHRLVWAYDVGPEGRLANKRLALDAGVYANWGTEHREAYYMRTIAHNTLIIPMPGETFGELVLLLNPDTIVPPRSLGALAAALDGAMIACTNPPYSGEGQFTFTSP